MMTMMYLSILALIGVPTSERIILEIILVNTDTVKTCVNPGLYKYL